MYVLVCTICIEIYTVYIHIKRNVESTLGLRVFWVRIILVKF